MILAIEVQVRFQGRREMFVAEDSEKGHRRNLTEWWSGFPSAKLVISCGLCLRTAQIFSIFKPVDSTAESSDVALVLSKLRTSLITSKPVVSSLIHVTSLFQSFDL